MLSGLTWLLLRALPFPVFRALPYTIEPGVGAVSAKGLSAHHVREPDGCSPTPGQPVQCLGSKASNARQLAQSQRFWKAQKLGKPAPAAKATMTAYDNVPCTWSITKTESYPASAAPYAADSSGELNILLHDGDTLGVDGTQVGVLK